MGLGSGPCFPLFCLAEQTAPCRQAGRQGEEEGRRGLRGAFRGLVHSPPEQAGWPGRQGYRGSPFCFVPSEWGQLLLSGGLCPPSGETVQDPQSLNNHPPRLSHDHRHSPSLSHTHPHPSISSARSAGGAQCFVDAQESEQTSRQRKRGLFIVSVARQKRFILPLRRSL